MITKHTEIQSDIEKTIKKVCEEFSNNPDIFLTESDVKAYLYHLLIQKSSLSNLELTASNTKTYPVHTEIRFYGNSGKFRYLSDIVVLDPSDLSTGSGGNLTNSKSFDFDRYYAIIEIKLQRTTHKKNLVKGLDEDVDKIKNIITGFSNSNNLQTKFYFVYLDRKEDIQDKINQHFQNRGLPDQYQLFYKGRRNHRLQPTAC